MHRKLFVVATLLFAITIAQAAWGVTGNAEITVTDSRGKRLPGKTVTFISTQTGTTVTSQTTDDTGVVFIPLDEGTYVVEVGEGEDKTRTEISITGGQTSSTTITVSTAAPPFEMPPMISFLYSDEVADDIPLTDDVSTRTDVINGEPRTQTTRGNLEEVNAARDFELNWNQTSAHFAVGLGHTDTFFPSVNVTVGRADVQFSNIFLADSSLTTVLSGDGLTFGVGFDVLFTNGEFFAGGGYQFTGFYDLELTRERFPPVQGGVITSDRIEISYYAHQIRGLTGYRFGVFFPYGGIVFWLRKVELTGTTVVDFSQSFPFPVITTVEFSSTYEEDKAAGLIGAGIRAGHFIAGAEGTFSSGYKTFRLNAGVAF